jgi:hypothetical protein
MLVIFLVLLVGLVMFWTLAGPSRSRRTGRWVNDAPPPRTTVAPDAMSSSCAGSENG